MLKNKKPSGEALSEPSEDFVNHNISNKRISVNGYTSFISKDFFSKSTLTVIQVLVLSAIYDTIKVYSGIPAPPHSQDWGIFF